MWITPITKLITFEWYWLKRNLLNINLQIYAPSRSWRRRSEKGTNPKIRCLNPVNLMLWFVVQFTCWCHMFMFFVLPEIYLIVRYKLFCLDQVVRRYLTSKFTVRPLRRPEIWAIKVWFWTLVWRHRLQKSAFHQKKESLRISDSDPSFKHVWKL